MHPAWGVLGFVLGSVISSFGATWALRREQGLQVMSGRSRCDHCAHELSYGETIPLASFLVLKGRCRHCASGITPFHPIAELLGGLLLTAILMLRPWPMSVAEAALAITLFVLALVDLRTLTLPNIGVALAALLSAVLGFLGNSLFENAIVALVFSLGLTGLALGLKRLRGRTMLGAGDIKLIAALSLWLGPDIFIALAVGSLLGLLQIQIAPSKPEMIAFGPAIIAGALIMGLFVRPWFTLGGL
jgi:leader peptidase (prepilin peptidase)/N-methyltransferase